MEKKPYSKASRFRIKSIKDDNHRFKQHGNKKRTPVVTDDIHTKRLLMMVSCRLGRLLKELDSGGAFSGGALLVGSEREATLR